MPFAPLPSVFLSLVQRLADRPHAAVDLGCGDGAFAGLPEVRSLRFVGVDRLGPPAAVPAVVGDALAPPLCPGGCDLVVAANLVRHLAPRRADFSSLRVWADLLKPHGALFVFEDAPRKPDGPAGNYARLQDFLLAVAPDRRGPLLAPGRVLERLAGLGLTAVASGVTPNTWPLDGLAVLEFLERGDPRPEGAAAELIAAIRRDGIACGPYWWACIASKGRTER